MVIESRTEQPDDKERQVMEALQHYQRAHPDAEIITYRQNSVSIRIRIIDADFDGCSRARREDEVWRILERLPEDLVAEVSMLLLLTPDEARLSLASHEFDNPIPYKL